jgi:oligosaccharide repeat unit polymerase
MLVTSVGICLSIYLLLTDLSKNLGISFLFLLCAIFSSGFQLRIEKKKRNVSYFLFGNFWITISFVLIFMVSPAIILTTRVSISQNFENYPWKLGLGNSIMLGSLALFSLTLGSTWSRKNVKNSSSLEQSVYTVSMIRSSILLILATSIYLVYMNQTVGLQGIFYTRQLNVVNNSTTGIGYFKDSPIFCLGILVANFAASKYLPGKVNKFRNTIILIFIFIYLIPYFSRGSRSIFIYIGLVVYLMHLSFQSRMIRKRIFFVILIILPLLIVSPRLYRTGTEVSFAAIKNGYSIQKILETVTGPDVQMAPALSILYQNLGNKVPYEYGRSYVAALGKPVPRVLWPTKPAEFDTGVNENLFPLTYRFYGVAFSCISEPLVNFGLIGVVLFFILLGKFNSYLIHKLDSRNFRQVFIFSWIVAFMFVLARGNLSTDYHRILFPLVAGLTVIKKTKPFSSE